MFPGIKSRCTVKYIQDEHGEKRRKMDFQRARFLAGFFLYVSAYMDRKLSSKTRSAAFRKEPKYIVVQDTFNLVRMESEVS